MEGVTGMMARLSHMQRVAAGGSAMYRTRVFFSDRVRATVATSPTRVGREADPGLVYKITGGPLRAREHRLSDCAPQGMEG